MAYKSKKFIVKMTCDAGDTGRTPTKHEVYTTLTSAVGYSGNMWVETVDEFTNPPKEFLGKIKTIQCLRSSIQGLTLVEAKDIVDAANVMGKFRTHGGITVEYNPDNDHYLVTDNRDNQ